MSKKKVLLMQSETCVDCRNCQLACSLSHEGVISPAKARISVLSTELKISMPLTCLQCKDPECVKVCPKGALTKNQETGVVELDKDKCIGCRLCVKACPYGCMSFSAETKKVYKCDTCGGDPSCVKVCPTGAISWVEENEETMKQEKVIAEKLSKTFGREV